MATENNAISVANNILVDNNLDLYANNITFRSISYRGYIGTTAAFSFGGANTAPSTPVAGAPVFTIRTEIDRFPFASESTLTNAGGLSVNRAGVTGHSSATHGYAAGGANSFPTPIVAYATIDRFPFTAPFVTATSVGSLTSTRYGSAGWSGDTFAFSASSSPPSNGNFSPLYTLDRWPFASATVNGAIIGGLLAYGQGSVGISSGKDGYHAASGGIYKFPFINAVRSVAVGGYDTGSGGASFFMSTISGITDGYLAGGIGSAGSPTPFLNILNNYINKFPFAQEITTASLPGTLTASKGHMSGISSDSNGYTVGGATGYNTSGTLGQAAYNFSSQTATVERFPYASGAVSGSSVATLSVGKWGNAGAQY